MISAGIAACRLANASGSAPPLLRACRTRPVMRFRSADEWMTALLSFQFDASRRQQTHVLKLWSNLIGLGGLLIGVGVVAFLLYRLLVVLK